MVDVSLDELRALARRSRHAHKWGALTVTAGMVAIPATLVANQLPPTWALVAFFTLMLGVGAMLVRFAHAAGQSRGAYRKLFRDIKKGIRAEAAQKRKIAGLEARATDVLTQG